MSERAGRGNQEGMNQQGELVIPLLSDYNEMEIVAAPGGAEINIEPSHGAPHGQHLNEEPHHIDIQTGNAATEQQVPIEGELVIRIRDYNEREIFEARGSVHIDIHPSHGAPHGQQLNEDSHHNDTQTGDAATEQVPTEDDVTAETQRIQRQLKLYKAAVKGNWNKALKIHNESPEEINRTITTRKETALHIAVLAEQTHFVKELIKKMSKESLAHRDEEGNTALFFAAATGKRDLAEAMLNENENLAITRNDGGLLPIHIAVFIGHKDMARYLYSKSSKNLIDRDHSNLLVEFINADMYDIAFNMIKEKEHLAMEKNTKETVLHALARKTDMLSRAHQRRKYFNLVSGSNDAADQNIMRLNARELLKSVWKQTILTGDRITDVVGKDWRPIFVAVEHGNIEFLRILIRSYPDLILKTNEKKQTIFHAAVVSRHREIFKLIHETGSFKNIIAKMLDDKQNNMLHLAGELAPSDRLNLVPGPAFQLHLELLWFEEVKNVVGPRLAKQENMTKETPGELFIKTHEDLIRRGEKWMKNTANYCMIVATLVATVVFAAAYTVPGGNDSNGFPIFLHRLPFKIFAIADAISLIFSISSVIIFLSLLTSTYALKDFVWSLPNKLVIGLACLFVSLLAMIVAFVSVFFVYFKKQQLLLRFAAPIALAACIPVGLFIWSHRRLIVEVFRSTYRSKKFFRPNPTNHLFLAAKVK